MLKKPLKLLINVSDSRDEERDDDVNVKRIPKNNTNTETHSAQTLTQSIEPILISKSEEENDYFIGIDCGTFYSQASYHCIGSSEINHLYESRISSIFYSDLIGKNVLEITEGSPALSIEYFRKFLNVEKSIFDSKIIKHLVKVLQGLLVDSNPQFIVPIPKGWKLDSDIEDACISTCFEHEAVIAYYLAQEYKLDFKHTPDETCLQQFKARALKFCIFNISGTGVYQCIVSKSADSLEIQSLVDYSFHSLSGIRILSEFCNTILKLCNLDQYHYESGELKLMDRKDEKSAKFTFEMNNLMMNLSQYGVADEICISETMQLIFKDEVIPEALLIKRCDFKEATLDSNMKIFNSFPLVLVGGMWNSPGLKPFTRKHTYLHNGNTVSVGCILRELMVENFKISFI